VIDDRSRGGVHAGAVPDDAQPSDPFPDQPADHIPDLAGAVLDVVDLIPPGRVMTYGDVAEYLGRCGPRHVGNVLARWGGAVAWWRVLKADGSPPPGHEAEALRRYRAERTPLRPSGTRVDLSRARWDGEPG
jgi:alkylated DNA nucleotide flippase Atl1